LDAFEFTPVTGATPSALYYTDPITVTGLSAGVYVYIQATNTSVDAGLTLDNKSSSTVEKFPTTDGSFLIRLSMLASPEPGAVKNLIVRIKTSAIIDGVYTAILTEKTWSITNAP
jgi:hypothetical protein